MYTEPAEGSGTIAVYAGEEVGGQVPEAAKNAKKKSNRLLRCFIGNGAAATTSNGKQSENNLEKHKSEEDLQICWARGLNISPLRVGTRCRTIRNQQNQNLKNTVREIINFIITQPVSRYYSFTARPIILH